MVTTDVHFFSRETSMSNSISYQNQFTIINSLSNFGLNANGQTFIDVWGESLGKHFASKFFPQNDIMLLWRSLDATNRITLVEYMDVQRAKENEFIGRMMH